MSAGATPYIFVDNQRYTSIFRNVNYNIFLGEILNRTKEKWGFENAIRNL